MDRLHPKDKIARHQPEDDSALANAQETSPGMRPRTAALPAAPMASPLQRRVFPPVGSTAQGKSGAVDDWSRAVFRPDLYQAPIQRKAEGQGQSTQGQNEDARNDSFRVDRGQLTFDAEGTEGGRFHSRTAHWPGGASGVTIGRGYDLGHHSVSQITADMTQAGIPSGTAAKFTPASGLTGKPAAAWLKTNGAGLPEITPEQQEALFNIAYGQLAADVERISANYAKTVGKRNNQPAEELQVDWATLHPAIRDLLVDLRYRGDYTPTTRQRVQPPAIANDLRALYDVMRDKQYWMKERGVPADRFQRRVSYLQAALGGAQSSPEAGEEEATTPARAQNAPAASSTAAAASAVAAVAVTATQPAAAQVEPEEQAANAPSSPAAAPGAARGAAKDADAAVSAAPQSIGAPQDYRVTASSLHVRSSPSTRVQDNKIGSLREGERVRGVPQEGGWTRIDYKGREAYVASQYVALVVDPSAAGTEAAAAGPAADARSGSGQRAPGGQEKRQAGPQGGAAAKDTKEAKDAAAAKAAGGGQLSGAQWRKIADAQGWSNTTDFAALDSGFGPKAAAFVGGLRAAGATVTVTAGLRHPKRAALMHFAWGVAKGQYTPAQANAKCQAMGIDINWDHGNAQASIAAASQLVDAFGLAHQASLTSNHIKGLAIDMKASNLPASITINGKTYNTVKGASGVAAARSLEPIGRDMGVFWFGEKDWVHWSHDGR